MEVGPISEESTNVIYHIIKTNDIKKSQSKEKNI